MFDYLDLDPEADRLYDEYCILNAATEKAYKQLIEYMREHPGSKGTSFSYVKAKPMFDQAWIKYVAKVEELTIPYKTVEDYKAMEDLMKAKVDTYPKLIKMKKDYIRGSKH